MYPGLHLSRPKADLCDRCERIRIELYSPDITAKRKVILEKEQDLHIDEAIAQRKVKANFVRDYTGRVDPNLRLSDEALPSLLSDEEPKLDEIGVDSLDNTHFE